MKEKVEPIKTNTLMPELLHGMDAYWRAANYLSAAQIYLYDNPRPPAMRAAAITIKRHLWGLPNTIVLDLHNGHAEGMNNRIQHIKQRACGFRNRYRFRNAIYFHVGGLDLSPPGSSAKA